jgi:hypothetical protein
VRGAEVGFVDDQIGGLQEGDQPRIEGGIGGVAERATGRESAMPVVSPTPSTTTSKSDMGRLEPSCVEARAQSLRHDDPESVEQLDRAQHGVAVAPAALRARDA